MANQMIRSLSRLRERARVRVHEKEAARGTALTPGPSPINGRGEKSPPPQIAPGYIVGASMIHSLSRLRERVRERVHEKEVARGAALTPGPSPINGRGEKSPPLQIAPGYIVGASMIHSLSRLRERVRERGHEKEVARGAAPGPSPTFPEQGYKPCTGCERGEKPTPVARTALPAGKRCLKELLRLGFLAHFTNPGRRSRPGYICANHPLKTT